MNIDATNMSAEDIEAAIAAANVENQELVKPALEKRKRESRIRVLNGTRAMVELRKKHGVEKIVVFSMPHDFGGCVIIKKFEPEIVRMLQRTMLDKSKSLTPDKCVELLQQPGVLLHPPMLEFQKWEEEYGALTVEVINHVYGESSTGGSAGK